MPYRPPPGDKPAPSAGSLPPAGAAATAAKSRDTALAILLAISFSHLFNDVMQSMLPAVYPLLRAGYHLSLLQIGLITAAYQITGSILQPVVGFYTDKKPLPYSLPFSALFTMAGLLTLAFSGHYRGLLLGACLVGLGSSIFHPEAARVARFASGGRFGFAQSVFQVGGNSGTALGPLLAALFINRQYDVGYFAFIAFAGFLVLLLVSRWYAGHLRRHLAGKAPLPAPGLSKAHIRRAVFMLVALMTAKYIYLSCMSNFYTFFAMEKYGLDTHQAQYLLFLYLGGIAAGTIFGGPIGDKIGARRVIWFSILGVLPFTLALPHVSLPLMAVLSLLIGLILASAFPAIVVFAQELMPGKIGTIAGLFYGLSFGIGALSSALLGALGDKIGNQALFDLCAFLPLLGIIAIFLPRLPSEKRQRG